MRKIIIHIGARKTGSSFLQMQFAKDAIELKDCGFNYLDHPSAKKASLGEITSGNGSLLLDILRGDLTLKKSKENLLFSNEILLSELLVEERLNRLLQISQEAGFSPCFAIYVRDLIGHSFSTWGQAIKRERCQMGYTDFLRQGQYDFLDDLLTWINLSKVHRFELKIYNYSNYKRFVCSFFRRNSSNKS